MTQKDREKINHIYFRFKEKILPFIGKEKFAIVVSGGSDSLALSALAKLYSLENDNDFVALIIDHKLRKESANEAKQTYKNLAQNFRLTSKKKQEIYAMIYLKNIAQKIKLNFLFLRIIKTI